MFLTEVDWTLKYLFSGMHLTLLLSNKASQDFNYRDLIALISSEELCKEESKRSFVAPERD